MQESRERKKSRARDLYHFICVFCVWFSFSQAAARAERWFSIFTAAWTVQFVNAISFYFFFFIWRELLIESRHFAYILRSITLLCKRMKKTTKKNQKIIPRKRQFRPHVNSLAFVPLMALHKKTAAENKIWTTFSINYRIVWKIYLNWIFCVCTEPFYWLFVRRNGVQ